MDERMPRDPVDRYDVTVELIKTVRDEMRAGFARVEGTLADQIEDRKECRKTHNERLNELERWRASVIGSISAIAAFVSMLMTGLVSWLTGRQH